MQRECSQNHTGHHYIFLDFPQLYPSFLTGDGITDYFGSPGKVCVFNFVVSDGLMPRAQRRSTDREHQLFVIH